MRERQSQTRAPDAGRVASPRAQEDARRRVLALSRDAGNQAVCRVLARKLTWTSNLFRQTAGKGSYEAVVAALDVYHEQDASEETLTAVIEACAAWLGVPANARPGRTSAAVDSLREDAAAERLAFRRRESKHTEWLDKQAKARGAEAERLGADTKRVTGQRPASTTPAEARKSEEVFPEIALEVEQVLAGKPVDPAGLIALAEKIGALRIRWSERVAARAAEVRAVDLIKLGDLNARLMRAFLGMQPGDVLPSYQRLREVLSLTGAFATPTERAVIAFLDEQMPKLQHTHMHYQMVENRTRTLDVSKSAATQIQFGSNSFSLIDTSGSDYTYFIQAWMPDVVVSRLKSVQTGVDLYNICTSVFNQDARISWYGYPTTVAIVLAVDSHALYNASPSDVGTPGSGPIDAADPVPTVAAYKTADFHNAFVKLTPVLSLIDQLHAAAFSGRPIDPQTHQRFADRRGYFESMGMQAAPQGDEANALAEMAKQAKIDLTAMGAGPPERSFVQLRELKQRYEHSDTPEEFQKLLGRAPGSGETILGELAKMENDLKAFKATPPDKTTIQGENVVLPHYRKNFHPLMGPDELIRSNTQHGSGYQHTELNVSQTQTTKASTRPIVAKALMISKAVLAQGDAGRDAYLPAFEAAQAAGLPILCPDTETPPRVAGGDTVAAQTDPKTWGAMLAAEKRAIPDTLKLTLGTV